MFKDFKFSKKLWELFGRDILFHKKWGMFYKSWLYHFFNGRRRKAVVAANYWNDESTYIELNNILIDNKLKKDNDFLTVKAIINWFNKTFPASKYYTHDIEETWNNPADTYYSLNARKAKVPADEVLSTDCDDYAILIYSLCRVAGVPKEDLYLCFMKAKTEWHLNVMYVYNNVPYALEGTYYPNIAIREFGKTPYMQLNYNNSFYYQHIAFLFNEDYSWNNKYKLKE